MSKQTDQDLYQHHQLLLLAADRAEDAMEQAWTEPRTSPISFWKLRDAFQKRKAIAERFEDKHYDRIQRYLKFIKCEADACNEQWRKTDGE
tara:strand:+ start:1978 stop:2250 length:273 start_codon:yes stop_codon:yes gene_type:complete